MSNESRFNGGNSLDFRNIVENAELIEAIKVFSKKNPDAKVLVDDLTMSFTDIYICKDSSEVDTNIAFIAMTAADEDEDPDGDILFEELEGKVQDLTEFLESL